MVGLAGLPVRLGPGGVRGDQKSENTSRPTPSAVEQEHEQEHLGKYRKQEEEKERSSGGILLFFFSSNFRLLPG